MGNLLQFCVPISALNEYNNNPSLLVYPKGLPTRLNLNPVGIIVTPTKGLATNLVSLLLLIFPTAVEQKFRYTNRRFRTMTRPFFRGPAIASVRKQEVPFFDTFHKNY